MKSIKYILFIAVAFVFQMSYSQGCESPGEGGGIKFFGFIQPTYQYNFVSENANADPDTDNSRFYFKRARFGVMGKIPYDFSYYFISELSPEVGVGIMDAYISYDRFDPYFKVSLGQFKSPFGAEQMQGCHKLYTIDRSIVVNNLASPIRDMGVTIFGGTGDKIKMKEGSSNIITYNFAYLNGEGRNLKDAATGKAFVGRLMLTPIKEISVGGSMKYNKYKPTETATTYNNQSVYGFDAQIKYKNFIVQGEYITATDEGDLSAIGGVSTSGSTSSTGGGTCGKIATPKTVTDVTTAEPNDKLEREGFYVTALYDRWKIQPVVKFEMYEPDKITSYDKISRWTTGINYFFNEWTRLQINYQYNFEEVYAREYPNDAVQVQLQVVIK